MLTDTDREVLGASGMDLDLDEVRKVEMAEGSAMSLKAKAEPKKDDDSK